MKIPVTTRSKPGIQSREIKKVEKEIRKLNKTLKKDVRIRTQEQRETKKEKEAETVEKTWNKNLAAYTFLIAVTLAVLSSLEVHGSLRIFLIFAAVILFFYLCFFNKWFGERIVRLLTKRSTIQDEYEAKT
jgi:Flp pilus assembly protein TadB